MSAIFTRVISRKILRLGPQGGLKRTFLSPAYYCNEIWDNRMNNPLFQRVNLDILYHELDQRFQKTRQISAVDVDIFANFIKDDHFIDELMDLVYKLRLSADTGNTLPSTGHAVIRILMELKKFEQLILTLDDRINYGIFLDDYTANLLLDTFWKSKDYVAGARVASQIMLQEDFKHPLTTHLSLLHCFKYLQKPGEWVSAEPPVEPEEEIKVRVKYIRNPYDDNHFDLKDPLKIVGKTLLLATNSQQGESKINDSLNILGAALYGDENKFEVALKKCQNKTLIKEILDLLPPENSHKSVFDSLKVESEDVEAVLVEEVKKCVAKMAEQDIAKQCEEFKRWEEIRDEALSDQKQQLSVRKRLEEIENIKKTLKGREQKLWFFEKSENIELKIEEMGHVETTQSQKKQQVKGSDDYVPPEILRRRS